MLTDFNVEIILQFQESLKRLQTDLELTAVADEVLQSQLTEIQQFFEHQIMTLNPEVFNPTILPMWQSYLTEIHKQMRLLTIDLRFLKASRQTSTTATRRTQMSDRLGTLTQYCDAILAKISAVLE
jgi:hypothetical protein